MTTPRRQRRWLRWLAGAAGVLVLGVIALGLVSQTATFRDWFRRQVIAQVNADLAGVLSIGSLEGNLYGRLVARHVRLDLDGARVLAVRRIEASYDVLALLRGRGLRIDAIAADGVAVQLIEDARGWNVMRLSTAPPEDETPTLAVTLDRIQITNAAVRIIRPAETWRLRAVTLDGSARFSGDEREVTLTAASFQEVTRGLALAEAVGRIAVDRRTGARAERVRIRTTASEIALDGAIGPADARAVDARLEVTRLAAAELAALLGGRGPAHDLRGAVRARGPARAIAVEGELRAAGDAATDSWVQVTGAVDASGDVPGANLTATLARVDLHEVLGSEAPESDLSGTVQVASAPSLPRSAAFTVQLDAPRVGATTLTSVALEGRADAETVAFETTVTTAAGSAEGKGTLSPRRERFDVYVTTHGLDLAPITGRAAFAGALNATVALAGEGFTPLRTRATAHVTLTPSRVGALEIRTGEVAGRADAGRLTVERAELVANAGTMTAGGEIALAPGGTPGPGAFHGELRLTDVRPLAALVDVPIVSGAGTLTVQAQGAPGALAAKATFAARGLAGPDWRVDTVNGTLDAERLGAADGRTAVRASARRMVVSARPATDLDLEARWQGTDSVGRGTLAVRAREGERRHALAAEIAATGNERHARVTELRVETDEDVWVASGAPVVVQRDARVAHVAIEGLIVRSSRGSIGLAGVVATAGTNDLDLVVEQLDLRTLRDFFPEDVSGELAGRAHLGGTLAAPRVDADVTVDAPTLGGVRYTELRSHLVVADGRARVESVLTESADRALRFEGAVPARFSLTPVRFEATGGLEGRLRADRLDLAFLGALVPGLVTKTGGTLDADLALAGSLAAPEARGTIAVEGGRAYVVPLGLTYDPVAIELRLEGRAASISRLTIQSGKGQLNGGGDARLGPDGPVMDARFEARAFPLFANQHGHGAASGWLWISGPLVAPVLQGSLTTDRLVLQIPETLPKSVHPPDPTIEVVGPGAAPPTALAADTPPPPPVPNLFERAAITVQLSVPHDAWVRRSDANIELEGWMTAWKKPGDELQLAGEIRGVRGWYAFQGKKFTLAEGSVRFSGKDLEPLLDIVATYTAGEYLVRLRVGGSITKPSLKLESEPALDQADVLAVLLFGSPANQLSREQSAGLREQALGIAGGYVASELRQSVANVLGVDDLQFDTGTAGMQDARVSVGKYVAPDIFVSLAHRFGAQSGEEVRVEYRFRPGWSLETSTDTFGRSGVDVFWKRRY